MKKMLLLASFIIMAAGGLLAIMVLAKLGVLYIDGNYSSLTDFRNDMGCGTGCGWFGLTGNSGPTVMLSITYVIAMICILPSLALSAAIVIVSLVRWAKQQIAEVQVIALLLGAVAALISVPFVSQWAIYHFWALQYMGTNYPGPESLVIGLHYFIIGFVLWSATKIAGETKPSAASTERASTLNPITTV